jgi:hypothetical protein
MRVFGQWAISDAVPADPLLRLQTCNDVTLQLNIVKTGIANGTLVVTGEHVVGPETNLSALVAVTTQLVLAGVQMWHERILGGGEDGGPAAGQPAPEGDPA